MTHCEAEAQALHLRAQLRDSAPVWRDFEIVPAGIYLGVPRARAADAAVWAAPQRSRADDLARMQTPTVAAAMHYRRQVLSVLLHMVAMHRTPRELARLEHDMLGSTLRLLVSAMPTQESIGLVGGGGTSQQRRRWCTLLGRGARGS